MFVYLSFSIFFFQEIVRAWDVRFVFQNVINFSLRWWRQIGKQFNYHQAKIKNMSEVKLICCSMSCVSSFIPAWKQKHVVFNWYLWRCDVRWGELCNQLDAFIPLSLLNVAWVLLKSSYTVKTKAAISASARTNKLTSCVNTDPKNCCTLESRSLHARCETSKFASCNVFCSACVYTERTWPPACFGLAVISCHCPSSLNITLEFHLEGGIHCECGNFICLMNKTGERVSW